MDIKPTINHETAGGAEHIIQITSRVSIAIPESQIAVIERTSNRILGKVSDLILSCLQ
jgi:methyl coenzyme M reductase subunit C-like uncharacterized protein (methanogenesis marker protein 7)